MTINRRRVGGWLLLLALSSWLLPAPANADEGRASRQLAVDIAATVAPRHSLRLGDLPVLSLTDRVVKLRFTLRGVPPQAFRDPGMRDPAIAPMGTPLATIDVTRVVVRR